MWGTRAADAVWWLSLAGMLRALPTLGVMTLFALIATSSLSLMPAIWALVLLAVPPILTGTYAGIAAVDRDLVDAARSHGHDGTADPVWC